MYMYVSLSINTNFLSPLKFALDYICPSLRTQSPEANPGIIQYLPNDIKLYTLPPHSLQDAEKRTPMHAASYCGETECVAALIQAGE